MIETDVIGHLIELESEAANLLLDAQAEVDSRITEAKQNADKIYKEKYEGLIANLELNLSEQKKIVDQNCEKILVEYKNHISATNQDKRSFNSQLDSYFFGSTNG